MYHKLNNLMKKKAEKGDVLSKSHAKAKSGILQDLVDDMMGMEGDKVKGLKKVTVASNSPKGLEKGLEKAKEIVGDAPMAEDEEMPEGEKMAEGEDMEEESEEESPEMEVAEEEGEEKDVEDLKAEIEKLKEKLAKHNLA